MQYHVEPLRMPSEDGRRRFAAPEHDSRTSSVVVTHADHLSPQSYTGHQQNPPPPPSNQGAVYVLHHDSHAPPVTIFHEQGQQIVELPPMYPDNRQLSPPPTSPGRSTSHASLRTDTTPSDGPAFLQQSRRPNNIGKGPPKRSNPSFRGPGP